MTITTNLPSPTISSKESHSTAVQVAIRVRPLTQQDRFQPRFSHSSDSDVIKTHGNTVTIVPHQKSFNFDHVFDTESTQDQLFTGVASNLVDRFLDGYNATILAYGQTSSGKTHTIMGSTDPDQEGIIPRAMSAFFERLNPTPPSSLRRPTSIASSTNLHSTFPPTSSGLRIPRRSVSSAKLRPLSILATNNNASPLRRDSASPTNEDPSTDKTARHTVHVSFVEIYNEELIDLLNPAPPNERPAATIREDTKGHIHWTGVKEVIVSNTEDVLRYLQIGTDSRATGSTDMNAKSSRSHAIFTVTLKQEKWVASKSSPTKSNSSSVRKREAAPSPVASRSSVVGMNRRTSSLNVKAMVGQMEQRQVTPGKEDDEDGEWMILHSKFHFVDLAGSERLKRTAAEGDRRKEGININAGLLALGNVISALASDPCGNNSNKKAAHIPYRDSKLTRLLQDSLGGNATTLMIACISSSELNLTETANTIKYAHRARNIKNKVERNEAEDWMTNDNPEFLRSLITKLKSDIRSMKTASSQSGSTVSLNGSSKNSSSNNSNNNRRNSSITSPTTSHSSSSEDDQPLPPSPSPSIVLNNAPPDLVDLDHSQLLIVSDLRRQIEELHNELTVTRERNQWVESQLGEKENHRSSTATSLNNINGDAKGRHSDSRVSHDSALGSIDFQHIVDPVIEGYENSISDLGSQLALARAALTHSDQAMAQQEDKILEFQTLRDQERKELITLQDALLKAQAQELSSKHYIEELESKLLHSRSDEHNSTLSEKVTDDVQVDTSSSATSNTTSDDSDHDAIVTSVSSISSSPPASDLQQQLEEKMAYVTTLEKRLKEMGALHNELIELRAEHSHTMTMLEQQLADMKESHAQAQNDLHTQYDQAQTVITELTSQVEKEKLGQQAAMDQHIEVQQRLRDHEQDTQTTLRKRLTELELLKLDVNALQQVEIRQEQIISMFEQKIMDMEQMIGQLHQQINVKDAHLKQLEEDNHQKTQWVQNVKKDLQVVLRDMAALGMERKNLDLIVTWMDKSLQRQDDRTVASLVSLGELQQLHKLRDADYEHKLQVVEKLEAHVLELSTSVEQGNASTRRLTLELTDAKAALADEQQRQLERDNPMISDIDDQRLVALESKVVELDQAVDQARKDRADLNHTLELKQGELHMAQLTIEQQSVKIMHIEQQLKEAMSSMEKERELVAANDTTGMLAELEDKLQVLQRARQLDQDEYDERFDRAIDDLEKSQKAYKDQSHVVISLEQSLKDMQERLDEAMAGHSSRSSQQLRDQSLRQRSDSTISYNHWTTDGTEERDVEEEAILSSSPPPSTSTSSSLMSKPIHQRQQQPTYDVATLLRQLTEQEALLHEKDRALMKLQQQRVSLPSSRTSSPLPSATPSRSVSINALASVDWQEQEQRIAQQNQNDIKDTATPEEMLAQLQQFANDKTQLMMQVDDLETQLTRQRAQFNSETKHLEMELMKLGAANDRMEKEMEQLMQRHVLPQPISTSVSSGPVFASGHASNHHINTNNVTSPPQTPRVVSPQPHGAKLHRDLSANSLAKLQNASSYRALSAMDYHHPNSLYHDDFGPSSTPRPSSQTVRSPVDRPGSVSSTTSSFIGGRSTNIPPPSAPPSNPLPPIPTTPLPAIPSQQPSLTSSSSSSSIVMTSPISTTNPSLPPGILQRTNSTQTNASLISDMSPPNSQQSTQTTAEQYDKMLRSLQRKAQIAESDVRAHQDVISKLEHQLSRSETSVRDVKKQLEVLNKEKLAYTMEIKNLRSQVTQIMTQQKSSGDEAGERRKQLEHSLEQERRLKEKAEKARLILENRMEELMTKKNKFMCF